jgi:NAD(P)-dependent dehydrogenase (short-subunit alcohol dehydrogenase family)
VRQFNKICEQIFKKHGKIDILINNAGMTFTKKDNEDYPIDKWEKTIKTNLTGAFMCSQTVIKFMKKQKNGSIINMTSINAEIGFPNNPAYIASKGGLKMLTKSFAKDYGKYGIRVNNLGPGYIKTDMTKKSFKNKKTRIAREKQTLLGKWGEASDLIGPCIFLSSDASKYVTGQDVYVDGGWLANGLVE